MNWINNFPVLRDMVLPVLDTLLLAFIIYRGYRILIQTRAVQLIKGVLLIVLLYLVAFFLDLRTLLWIMNLLAPSLVIGVAIVFQPEMRKIFTRIGQGRLINFGGDEKQVNLESVVAAAAALSSRRWGALLVFQHTVELKHIMETGTTIDAVLTEHLLLTVFAPDAALHDGAVVIADGKIAAAGCFLPLSDQQDIRQNFGTRHRAALGLAEESDALVLIVSEETGAVSLAYNGNLYYDLSLQDVRTHVAEQLVIDDTLKEEPAR